MLNILGTSRRLCDGATRRGLLQLGGLGALGLTLGDWLRGRQAPAAEATHGADRAFGKAKACILLFPYGSPPQHETFDPKPEAPRDIQGELGAIESSLPGLRICELLPRIAPIMDRTTVIRSMTHPYPLHGVAYAATGMPTYDPSLETRPRDPQIWPYMGSIVDYLTERQAGGAQSAGAAKSGVPRHLGLPWLLNSKSDLVPLAGPYGGFLGQAYDPVWTDFDGQGTKVAPKLSEGQTKEFLDPYAGLTAAGRLRLSDAAELPADLGIERLRLRRTLLAQFDRARRLHDEGADQGTFDKNRQMAYSLLESNAMREALDLSREPMPAREKYGLTLFGQSCLAARRLVEAGCKFITVFWDAFGIFAACAWDTHANHYPRLKEYLLPGFDSAYSALISDLDDRGLLDETLVVWMSEHGRTPQIDSKPRGAGRHHWSRAYSAVLAGGGAARGRIVGASDKIGGDVKDTPVSPKDIQATAFHLLGIDAQTTLIDPLGRPVPIAGAGRVRSELLA